MKNINLPLIIGILLPVVIIIIICIAVFLPSFFVNPQYNFIYTTTNNTYLREYKNIYKLEEGKIVLEPVIARKDEILSKESPNLYLYNIKNNSSHLISLEEANKYDIDPGPTSPDGYNLKRDYGHAGIFELFGSSSRGSYIISKGSKSKKLTGLIGIDYWGPDNIDLIGWIK